MFCWVACRYGKKKSGWGRARRMARSMWGTLDQMAGHRRLTNRWSMVKTL